MQLPLLLSVPRGFEAEAAAEISSLLQRADIPYASMRSYAPANGLLLVDGIAAATDESSPDGGLAWLVAAIRALCMSLTLLQASVLLGRFDADLAQLQDTTLDMEARTAALETSVRDGHLHWAEGLAAWAAIRREAGRQADPLQCAFRATFDKLETKLPWLRTQDLATALGNGTADWFMAANNGARPRVDLVNFDLEVTAHMLRRGPGADDPSPGWPTAGSSSGSAPGGGGDHEAGGAAGSLAAAMAAGLGLGESHDGSGGSAGSPGVAPVQPSRPAPWVDGGSGYSHRGGRIPPGCPPPWVLVAITLPMGLIAPPGSPASMPIMSRNRLMSGRTSLRPATASCILRMAALQPGEVVLDPCCGVGTIPIEGALAAPGACFLGGDNDTAQLVEAGGANLQHALLRPPPGQGTRGGASASFGAAKADLAVWDACRLPLRRGAVDVVISDLPWGIRENRAACGKRHRVLLYPRLLRQLTVLLAPGPNSRAVLVSGAPRIFRQAWDKASAGLRIVHQREIVIGAMWVELYVIKRA